MTLEGEEWRGRKRENVSGKRGGGVQGGKKRTMGGEGRIFVGEEEEQFEEEERQQVRPFVEGREGRARGTREGRKTNRNNFYLLCEKGLSSLKEREGGREEGARVVVLENRRG